LLQSRADDASLCIFEVDTLSILKIRTRPDTLHTSYGGQEEHAGQHIRVVSWQEHREPVICHEEEGQ
jgi:hypothetical protein